MSLLFRPWREQSGGQHQNTSFPVALIFLFFLWVGICPIAMSQDRSPAPSTPFKDSLDYYAKAGNLKKAMDFARQAEQWLVKKKKTKTVQYGQAAFDLGNLAFKLDDYPTAEIFLFKSLETRKLILGEDNLETAHCYSRLGSLKMYQGQFLRSDSLHQHAMAIRKKILGPDDKDVAKTASSLCQVNGRGGNPHKALEYGLESCRIYLLLGGPQSPEYLINRKQLANVYGRLGQYAESEKINRELIEIQSQRLGEDNDEVVMLKVNLGTELYPQGRLREAEQLFLEAFPKAKVGSELHMMLCNNLGTLYQDLNDFVSAEQFLRPLIDISRQNPEQQSRLQIPLSNLALTYLRLGNTQKAKTLLGEALQMQREKNQTRDADYAIALCNMSLVWQAEGNISKAGQYLDSARIIFHNLYGDNHDETNFTLMEKGKLLANRGFFQEAEKNLLAARATYLNLVGMTSPKSSQSIENLGNLYLKTQRYEKADSCFSLALSTYLADKETRNPSFVTLKKNQALAYWLQGKMLKAEEAYSRSIKELIQQISTIFPTLSQNEKEKFYEANRGSMEIFNTFSIERSRQNPAVLGRMFDVQLETKALLLNSSAKWKQRIKTSGDKKLFARFSTWEQLQDQIKMKLTATGKQDLKEIDSLEHLAETLEKELSARSEHFAKMKDKIQYSWRDVQKKLKPGEAAVEMVRFRKFGPCRWLTDSSGLNRNRFQEYDLTDTVWYAALIILPASIHPELVLLTNGNELEGKQLTFNKNSIRNKALDHTSYGKYWKKIAARLNGIRHVYFCPDGVYHSINLNTLYNPETKKYLLEETEIQLLTSSKDLIIKANEEELNKLAYLFGFPNFEAPFEEKGTTKPQRYATLPYYVNRERSAAWERDDLGKLVIHDLPGTKIEVERISDILASQGWEVHAFIRERAMEENLKESFKPRLLHIATHGFFEHDSTRGSNPLLHSGLLLSGAAKTLIEGHSDITDDGILTAYEAMNLNLDNTDLVVLSACETGLGEIKNGEGVYGLQRAFKVAGARSIIMSLWKVDDEATQELMVSFYKHWLGSSAVGATVQTPTPTKAARPSVRTATHSKRSAFLAAQKELKAKYPNPYYWGAFVMVGE